MAGKFEITKAGDGTFSFEFLIDGTPVAQSPVFEKEDACRRGVKAVKKNSRMKVQNAFAGDEEKTNPKYLVEPAENGARFTLFLQTGEPCLTGTAADEAAALAVIEQIGNNANAAQMAMAEVVLSENELRQIGVRDKARMVGGLGICGRPFCCASFLDDIQPVSIKMAKTQNLSLNPTKISGTCGRLMCCLKYEQDAYEDLIRNSPRMDSFVDTPEGRGTVVEVGLLRQRVKVRMEDNPETISVFSNEDIAVLRSGKARKNDPPIPADLAPISGSGKRVRREQTEEKPVLEPILFRYSTENIVDDPEDEKPETA